MLLHLDTRLIPLPDTLYTKVYLDAIASQLRLALSTEEKTSYDVTAPEKRIRYDFVFEEETELTGFMQLHLWIQIDEGDEADLFVQLQKLDSAAEPISLGPFPLAMPGIGAADLPVTRGWLRASYRELDPDRATEFQRCHTYRQREPLASAEPIAAEVENWPTSATFRAGEGLRLLISGKDNIGPQTPPTHDDANLGAHNILTDGEYDTNLVLPVISPREGSNAVKLTDRHTLDLSGTRGRATSLC